MTDHQRKPAAFLLKTYEMLQIGLYSDLIRWNSAGDGFIITNMKQFAETVLPIYFKHKRMPSFIRQLNMYGFSKNRNDRAQSYYQQENFFRGGKDNIALIQRRAEHKQNKNFNENEPINSMVSIDCESQDEEGEEILREKVTTLLHINNLLLSEQITNLKIISRNSPKSGAIAGVVNAYAEAHYKILMNVEDMAKRVLHIEPKRDTFTRATIQASRQHCE